MSSYVYVKNPNGKTYSKSCKHHRRSIDKESLPQINLPMLTGVKSLLPLYYRIIPRSIKDVNTLQDSLANISFIEKTSFHYVMDKSLYSESKSKRLP